MAGATRRPDSQVQSTSNRNVIGFFTWTDRFGVKREVIRVEGQQTDGTGLGYYSRLVGESSWTQVQILTGEYDGVPSFVTANGKLFIVDGYNAYIWDGTGTSTSRFTTWNRLPGPTSSLVGTVPDDAPSASAIPGTGLTADAEYEVTFVFGDSVSGQENRHSAPAVIMRVRTTKANRDIRIDTGYAGRDFTTSSDPDRITSFLHLPTTVASLTTARIIGLISKLRAPGIWFQPEAAASAGTSTRVIPQTTKVDADSNSGQQTLNVTSTTDYLAGDQVVIDPDSSGGGREVHRIATVQAGISLTMVDDLSFSHTLAQADKVVPIISLVFDTEPTTDQYKEFYGPPAEATGIVSHMDSIWCWGAPNFPTRIWFTDPDTPETFPANNFIDVDPDNPNDPIMALVPFGKGFGSELLVLRLNSVWRLQGNSLTTFLSQLVQGGVGCVGEHAVVQLPDGTVMFAGFEDIWRFDGSSIISMTKERIRHNYRSSFGLVDVGGSLT